LRNLSHTLDVAFQIKLTSTHRMTHVPGVGSRESKGIGTREHNKTRMRRKRKIRGCHASARHANKL